MTWKFNRRKVFPVLMMVVGLFLMGSSFLIFIYTPPYSISNATPVELKVSSSGNTYPEIRRISLDDAKSKYDQEQAIFIDVRGEPFYSIGHIAGSLSIPEDQLMLRMDELNPNIWIITYCSLPSEESSARVARILLDRGFPMVMPLQGGLEAWLQSGFPIE